MFILFYHTKKISIIMFKLLNSILQDFWLIFETEKLVTCQNSYPGCSEVVSSLFDHSTPSSLYEYSNRWNENKCLLCCLIHFRGLIWTFQLYAFLNRVQNRRHWGRARWGMQGGTRRPVLYPPPPKPFGGLNPKKSLTCLYCTIFISFLIKNKLSRCKPMTHFHLL